MTFNLRFQWQEQKNRQKISTAAKHVVIIGSYFLCWFMLWKAAAFYEITPNISAWYPPAGLTFAMLLLFGLRYLPVVFALELIVGAGIWLPEHFFGWVLFPALITGGYGLAAGTLLSTLDFDSRFSRLRDTLGFIGVGVGGALLVASLGMVLFVATGIASLAAYWQGMLDWWIGDAIGITILTPVLLIYGQPIKTWVIPKPAEQPVGLITGKGILPLYAILEIGCYGLLMLLALWATFVLFRRTITGGHSWYLLYLPIIGIAFRYGLPGSTLAVLIINVASVVILKLYPIPPPLIELQIFMLSMALLNLILAAVIGERKTSREALEKARNMMEERAAELSAINRKLHGEIASRNRVQQELRQLSKVFMDSADPIFITDFNGTILNLNIQAQHVYGWNREALLGQSIKTLVPPQQHACLEDLLRQCRQGKEIRNVEEIWWNQAGKPCLVLLTLSPLTDEARGSSSMAIIVRDITEQKRTEAALQQAQKMEAVGQLTSGLAHDFNNLLTIIMGNLQIIKTRLKNDSKLYQFAQAAWQGALRGAELTQKMLAYSRKQPLQPKVIDLNQLVAGMTTMLHRTLGEAIEIETMQGEGLWKTLADPHQVETCLLNLALNARDAMPQGGKLTIETANICLDAVYTANETNVIPGDYVMLAVSDTGTGMSPTALERAFEPFYTTKDVGKGSGLGLSMVYGFAKQSNGHVKIYSEPGQGTSVKLYLPRTQSDAAQESAKSPTTERNLPEGHETILVVEDNEGVRELAVTLLTTLGYTVLEAPDGEAALAILKQEQSFDLLFTDVVLPGRMSGPELVREAQRRRPNLKVLYTSGYTQNAIVHHGRLDNGVALLSKPYQKEDLAYQVRQVLDGRLE
jgi:PAS domain S-box-containing protein